MSSVCCSSAPDGYLCPPPGRGGHSASGPCTRCLSSPVFSCFRVWGLADPVGTAPPRATHPTCLQTPINRPRAPPHGLPHSRPLSPCPQHRGPGTRQPGAAPVPRALEQSQCVFSLSPCLAPFFPRAPRSRPLPWFTPCSAPGPLLAASWFSAPRLPRPVSHRLAAVSSPICWPRRPEG